MIEKINSKVKGDNNTLIKEFPKTPILCEKIQNKMKKHKMTNFNFVLENEKDRKKENKTILEKSNKDEEILKIQELPTDENEKNKVLKNLNNSENFIIIPLEKSPKTENKCLSISQYSDFSFGKNNNKFLINNKHFENNNNIFSSNKYDKNKENNQKYENIDIVCEGFENLDEYNIKKSNDLIKLNEDKNNNLNNNNKLLRKKTKIQKNSKKRNNNIKTDYEFIDINNSGGLNVQTLILLKLIEKYSYKYIFHLFIKQYAKRIPEMNNNYEKEIEIILNELIKELGIEKVMRILLSLSNSTEKYIKFSPNKKNMEKINEINNKKIKYAIEKENKLYIDEEKKNIEIIYLDEEDNNDEDFKNGNNNLIITKEDRRKEKMEKKHIIMNENNFENHINELNEEELKNNIFNFLNTSNNLNNIKKGKNKIDII